MRQEWFAVPSKRFSELQDECFETSTRLRLAQTSEEKLELLNELQRIVIESKRALAEPDPDPHKSH
jgi:hypothetical protein